MKIELSTNTMRSGTGSEGLGGASKTSWGQQSPLSVCFYPKQHQEMKILQEKMILSVDHFMVVQLRLQTFGMSVSDQP